MNVIYNYKKGVGWVSGPPYHTLELDHVVLELRPPNIGEHFSYAAADNKDPNGWIVNNQFNEIKFRSWLQGYSLSYFDLVNDGRPLEVIARDLNNVRGVWASRGLSVYFFTAVARV